jgi:hypothetical protein
MNKVSHFAAPVLCALALFISPASLAAPEPITASDKNAEVLHEAVVMSASMLYSELGPAQTILTYKGTFTDTGWSAEVDGNYLGRTVDFNFTGSFAPLSNTGSYTASGMLGSDPWSGSGSYSFVDNAVGDATLVFDFQASVLGLIWDRHTLPGILNIKTRLPNGDISKTDFGRYRRTLFGIPVGRPFYEQISDWVYPGDRPQDAIVRFDLPDEGIALRGTGDFAAGTASGVVVIPEPASYAMLALGLGVMVLARSRRAAPRAKPTWLKPVSARN